MFIIYNRSISIIYTEIFSSKYFLLSNIIAHMKLSTLLFLTHFPLPFGKSYVFVNAQCYPCSLSRSLSRMHHTCMYMFALKVGEYWANHRKHSSCISRRKISRVIVAERLLSQGKMKEKWKGGGDEEKRDCARAFFVLIGMAKWTKSGNGSC